MKIGSYTPIWNAEKFIKPHFEMLSSLDRNLVGLQTHPLPSYVSEHKYGGKDRSEQILRKYFPKVELFTSGWNKDFEAGFYNEGMEKMEDCDIVFFLNPDMLFTDKDWKILTDFIRDNDYDCYKLDFRNCSINYYGIGRYDLGIKDAKEHDPIAVNPQTPFHNILEYRANSPYIIDWDSFMCHHFKGWKVTAKLDWKEKRYRCPEEIKEKMEKWQEELKTL